MADIIRENKIGLAALGLFLAIGMVYSVHLMGKTLIHLKFAKDESIRVKGYAELNATSSLAKWTGTVSVRAATKEAAYKELDNSTKAFVGLLKAEKVVAAEMTLSAVSSRRVNKRNEKGRDTGELDYFSLSRNVLVESNDVKKVARVARESTRLLNQGVSIRSGSPAYYLDNKVLDKLKLDLIAAATDNAKQRAQAFAAGGLNLGGIQSAHQGVFQVTPPNDSGISDYGRFDTTTIMKTVKSVVTVTFALNN